MLDFDFDDPRLTANPTKPQVKVVADPLPVPVEKVTVTPLGDAAGYKAKSAVSTWNWSDLRDYIARQIEDRHGPQVRDAIKESSIIKGFISRWGIERAHAIATAAFEVHDGMWRNAPISMSRFAKGSDPYFADIIAKNL